MSASLEKNEDTVLLNIAETGVARITLNRPRLGNAYNDNMLARLIEVLERVGDTRGVRAVVIAGAGRHFQVGADLNWVTRVAEGGAALIHEVSRATVRAFRLLNEFPRPTLALVQGSCFGGGVGIVACCDIVIASSEAQFAISEVLVGQAPLPIVPQLNAAIGLRQARRYALSGERFGAAAAREMGLVHEVVAPAELAEAGNQVLQNVLSAAPGAAARTKSVLLACAGQVLNEELAAMLADGAARQRLEPESREGLAAFGARRKPSWALPPVAPVSTE